MARTMIDNPSNKIPCIRCGVCCSSGVCSHGIEDDRGLCTFLFIDSYRGICRTSCTLVIDKRVDFNDIAIGKGCVLRHIPSAYTYSLDQMRKKLAMI